MEINSCKTIEEFIKLQESKGVNEQTVFSVGHLIRVFLNYISLSSYQEFTEYRKNELSSSKIKKERRNFFDIIFNKKEDIKLNFEKETSGYKGFSYLFTFFEYIVQNQESIRDIIQYANPEPDSVYIKKSKNNFEKEGFIDERTFYIIKRYSKSFNKSLELFYPEIYKMQIQNKILNF